MSYIREIRCGLDNWAPVTGGIIILIVKQDNYRS